MAEQKTNVMRVLDQKKIAYTAHSYPHGDEAVDGVTVAKLTGLDPARVFKTLVSAPRYISPSNGQKRCLAERDLRFRQYL